MRRGLESLLFVFLIAGCQQSPEDRAIAEVIRLGGNVKKDGQAPGMPVIAVILAQGKVTDGELQVVKSFPQLRTLDLRRTVISDRGLAHVEGLTNLQNLNLDYTGITNSGLSRLTPLNELRKLSLNGTAVDDIGIGLRFLDNFPKLEQLSIRDTQVSDRVIADLQEELPGIDISRESQTEKGLSSLQPGKKPKKRRR